MRHVQGNPSCAGSQLIAKLTCEPAAVKRALSHVAADTIVLASSEKLNAASPYRIVGLEEVTGLITERTVDDTLIKPYEDLGITVTRV